MELVVRSLRILGYNSDHGDRTARAKAFVVVTVLWIILPGLVYVCRHYSSEVGSAMKAFEEVVLITKVVLHAAKTIRNRVELEQIYNDLEEALVRSSRQSNSTIQRKFFLMERRLKLILNGYLGFEMFAIVGYCLLPPVVFIIRCLIDEDQLRVLPNTSFEADFYVFDYKSSLMTWLGTSLITTIVGAIIIISGAVLDCLSWGLLYRTSELFQMVAMKIRCLDEIKETEKFQTELTNLVNLQEVANQSARKIEKFLSELVLYLFGVCICVLCAIMLVLSMPNVDRQLLLSMGIALCYALFQIFSYSMLGTQIITASTSVAEAAYETNWYERINSEQRSVLFVLMRSQKMVALTVGKGLTVHRATFGAVLKSAFSYYSVLRQLYDE